jgi:Secretion system C-terminal sorting domain
VKQLLTLEFNPYFCESKEILPKKYVGANYTLINHKNEQVAIRDRLIVKESGDYRLVTNLLGCNDTTIESIYLTRVYVQNPIIKAEGLSANGQYCKNNGFFLKIEKPEPETEYSWILNGKELTQAISFNSLTYLGGNNLRGNIQVVATKKVRLSDGAYYSCSETSEKINISPLPDVTKPFLIGLVEKEMSFCPDDDGISKTLTLTNTKEATIHIENMANTLRLDSLLAKSGKIKLPVGQYNIKVFQKTECETASEQYLLSIREPEPKPILQKVNRYTLKVAGANLYTNYSWFVNGFLDKTTTGTEFKLTEYIKDTTLLVQVKVGCSPLSEPQKIEVKMECGFIKATKEKETRIITVNNVSGLFFKYNLLLVGTSGRKYALTQIDDGHYSLPDYLPSGRYEIFAKVGNYECNILTFIHFNETGNTCSFITIAPNPTPDSFEIINTLNLIGNYVLYNSVGQTIVDGKLENLNLFNGRIDLSGLMAGVYLLKIEMNGGICVMKIIKK